MPTLAVAQECNKETDEFTGTFMILCDWHEVLIEEQPGERLYEAKMRIGSGSTGNNYLAVHTHGSSWNFLDETMVYALIDGYRYEWQIAKKNRDVNNDATVDETVITMVSSEDLFVISQSSVIRLKIGRAVLDVSSALPGSANRLLAKTP